MGFIPICSYCRRIRDDENYWRSLEDYVAKNTEALLTHGMCPSCAKKILPDEEE